MSAPRKSGQGWIFVAKPGVEEQLLMVGALAMRVRPYTKRPRRYDKEDVKQLRAQPWTRTRAEEAARVCSYVPFNACLHMDLAGAILSSQNLKTLPEHLRRGRDETPSVVQFHVLHNTQH